MVILMGTGMDTITVTDMGMIMDTDMGMITATDMTSMLMILMITRTATHPYVVMLMVRTLGTNMITRPVM